jgi:4'-phosphopantetheinyl transferase
MAMGFTTLADAIVLDADVVHVWEAPLDSAMIAADEWRDILSSGERARAERFLRDDARRRFVAAHTALRSILGRYLDVLPRDVPIVTGAHGKPRLDVDSAANDYCFNLAHSGELALVAVTRGCEVGVDVEQLRTVGHLQEIAERYFTAAESDAIQDVDELQRIRRFLMTWTAKEAVLKASGRGLSLPLDHCEVRLDSAAQWVALADPSRSTDSCASRWWLQRVGIEEPYFAAVATSLQRVLAPVRRYRR